MKISYEIQIWLLKPQPWKERHWSVLEAEVWADGSLHKPNGDALGIPNNVLKFSNKRTALLNFEELIKAEKEGRLPSIEHIVLMEYGANKEFPDDGDVITQW